MTVDAHRPEQDPQETDGPADAVQELVDEVEQLKQALWSHATVDQAIGVLLVLGHIDPDEAWGVLRTVSMRTNTKLRVVAESILKWRRTGQLAPELREELDRQLLHRKRTGSPAGW
ncbi:MULTISPECIES: ANTAR domain-containing protein [Streptomyces]